MWTFNGMRGRKPAVKAGHRALGLGASWLGSLRGEACVRAGRGQVSSGDGAAGLACRTGRLSGCQLFRTADRF